MRIATTDLVVVSSNVGLIQGGIIDDAIVVKVDHSICSEASVQRQWLSNGVYNGLVIEVFDARRRLTLVETLVEWDNDVMGDGLLTILLLLFSRCLLDRLFERRFPLARHDWSNLATF